MIIKKIKIFKIMVKYYKMSVAFLYSILGFFIYLVLTKYDRELFIKNNQIISNYLSKKRNIYDKYVDPRLNRHSWHYYKYISHFLFSDFCKKHILKVNSLWDLDETFAFVTYKQFVDNYDSLKKIRTEYLLFKLLCEYIEKYKPKTIIELGCGNASFSMFLYDKYGDDYFEFVAVDLNKKYINYLQDNIKEPIRFYSYDVISLLREIVDKKISFKPPILFFDYYMFEYLTSEEFEQCLLLLKQISGSLLVSSQPSGGIGISYFDESIPKKEIISKRGLINKNYPYFLKKAEADDTFFVYGCERGANLCFAGRIV